MERTIISFEPGQLQALRDEAHALGISLAELVRRIVSAHHQLTAGDRPTRETLMGLVALGSGKAHDVSERHDDYLGEALVREHDR
jgi:hypothetical protein